MDYKQAGVDIAEGYKAVERYRDLAAGTLTEGIIARSVINEIGSFAGMLSLKELIQAGAGMEDPVLVSGTDGVGTKLRMAVWAKPSRHDWNRSCGHECERHHRSGGPSLVFPRLPGHGKTGPGCGGGHHRGRGGRVQGGQLPAHRR